MPRTVTITFGDNSSHVYNNVPDDVTPEQITSRAGTDFAGKQVTNIDGGRKPEPTSALGRIARSFGRGYEEATPADHVSEQYLLKHGMQAPLISDERRAKMREEAQQEKKSREQDIKEGSWLTTGLPEFIGELSANPFAGAMKVGGPAVKGVSRLAEPAISALEQSRFGRAMGFASGERQVVPFKQGSLAEARAADVAAQAAEPGSVGMRAGNVLGEGRIARALEPVTRPAVQRAERISAALPGGGPIRGAGEAAQRSVAVEADRIAADMAAEAQTVAPNVQGAMNRGNATLARETEAFWRSDAGPNRVWQALQASGQSPRLQTQAIQRATRGFSGSLQYRQLLASNMLARMGREAGGNFNAELFLRQWEAMAPAARDTVFGYRAIGSEYGRDLTSILMSMRRLEPYANMLRRRPISIAGVSIQPGAAIPVAEILWGVLKEKIGKGVAYASLTAPANNILARALTNPQTAKWVAGALARRVAPYATGKVEQWSGLSDMDQGELQ